MSIRRSEPQGREYAGNAGMEGRIRTKLEMGHELDAEERAYLAHAPGAREVKAEDVPKLPRVDHQ